MNPPVTAAQLSSAKSGARPEDSDILTIAFDDNRALSLLCGGHDENLALIEHRLAVEITPRGNRLAVRGLQANRDAARDVLTSLYSRARRGLEIARGDVEGAIRMREAADHGQGEGNRTRRKLVLPRTPTQGKYVEAIRKNELVFGVGPAGTGKTYLAVACAA
ncbi:MAG: PhoH family protein, partial [Alphaproteobacteria bacterium]|nr:PhoH family protein [Alphaproteobacteria bacterium]